MRSVFILCAGTGSRWKNYLGVPKQFAPIFKEPLLLRTIRLLNERGYAKVFVIGNPEEFPKSDNYSFQFINPKKRKYTIESLLSSKAYWDLKNIVLLGDVFYTETVIDQILHSGGLHFFGRKGASKFTFTPYGEIFGLTFTQQNIHILEENINWCVKNVYNGGRGKLWDLYRRLLRFNHDEKKFDNQVFLEIHDFTDDIDCPEEYDKVISRWRQWESGGNTSRWWLTNVCEIDFFLSNYKKQFLKFKSRTKEKFSYHFQLLGALMKEGQAS